MTGRDLDEMEIGLTFDKESCTWKRLGSTAEVGLTPERRRTLELLREKGPMGPAEVAVGLGENPDTVRSRLWRMCEAEQLVLDNDRYAAPGP